jgi:GH15 family glucan-1,4-alpha-glucosidase
MTSRFHVLREYALLADGERGALVAPDGNVAWLCFPRWDSPAVFAALLGGDGGYAVSPAVPYVWGGYYEPSTLIWRNRWVCEDAIVECREALALPARADAVVLLRRLEVHQGRARLTVRLDLRSDYGRARPQRIERTEAGLWQLTAGAMRACWSGAADAREDQAALTLALELGEGERHDLVLTLGDASAPIDPQRAWAETEQAWRARRPRLDVIGERDAVHACAVLSGLTSGGGGMVAAATMSLPERAGQGRSYDYRYVWIRDQCYAGQAAARAGVWPLLDAAVGFTRERLLDDGAQLAPAYTTTGGRVPGEHRLGLRGYPGGADVAGNWVNDQFQLDAFGEALLLFAAADARERLEADGWRAAHTAAQAIAQRHAEPDSGIWELEPREWTHSRLICAAGLRALAARPAAARHAPDWLALADRLVADAGERCVAADGQWMRAPDDPRVDAALLLASVRGAVAGDDARTRATLAAVLDQLTQDGYCYRFRPDRRPLGEAEGAFVLCGFLLALALHQQGDSVAAARWFERTRAACGPPGLFSEEFDVRQRQLRGNLPQAFVHALLLETAVTLMSAEAMVRAPGG